ncbi:MAG: amylo-alpha-1,6-glucosidase, partial [Fusobacteriota bacterium]
GEGYKPKGYPVLKNYATFYEGKLNDRTKVGNKTKIYPYGVKSTYKNDVTEEFYLLSGYEALNIKVSSKTKGKLGVMPFIDVYRKSIDIKQIDNNIILLSIKKRGDDYPSHIAITADKDITFFDKSFKDEGMEEITGISQYQFKALFETQNKEKDLKITMAFSEKESEAIKLVKKLSGQDTINKHKQKVYDFLTDSYFWSNDLEYNRALMWSKAAAYTMVANQYGRGIWAGLPWFRDNWGRDTFIALPGTLLVTGQFDEAKEVINNFAKYQNRGNLELEVSYDTKAKKDKAVKLIKKNFAFRMKQKDGKLYNPIANIYINKLDELDKIISKFNKIEGIKAKYTVKKDENYGRVPNRVTRPEDIIYNTTDGTPWMIREIYDYVRYTGDTDYIKEIYPVVELAIDQAIENFTDEDGFLTHAQADTWMDAKKYNKPWSPRGNRANDIQALWYVSLKVGEEFAREMGNEEKADRWKEISSNLKDNFTDLFWNDKKEVIADRVKADGTRDEKVRPNQLMVITTPFEDRLIKPEIEAKIVKNSVTDLLYPYGIASLSEDDEYFHPYHITSDKYHKDAAYHNGTVWGWNAGFTVSSIVKYGYKDFAYEFTKNLSDQILNMGCRGSMSENIEAFPDEDGNITLSGTYSQAWSVSEFNRNGYQDYIGFNPNLLKGEIEFSPAIPEKWDEFTASIVFGDNNRFNVDYKKEGNEEIYDIKLIGDADISQINFSTLFDKKRVGTVIDLENKSLRIKIKDKEIFVNGDKRELKTVLKSYKDVIGNLEFRKPGIEKSFKSIEEKGFLSKELID